MTAANCRQWHATSCISALPQSACFSSFSSQWPSSTLSAAYCSLPHSSRMNNTRRQRPGLNRLSRTGRRWPLADSICSAFIQQHQLGTATSWHTTTGSVCKRSLSWHSVDSSWPLPSLFSVRSFKQWTKEMQCSMRSWKFLIGCKSGTAYHWAYIRS